MTARFGSCRHRFEFREVQFALGAQGATCVFVPAWLCKLFNIFSGRRPQRLFKLAAVAPERQSLRSFAPV
jgi:hypothetical protein